MDTKALPNMDQDITQKPILAQKPLDKKTREILSLVREQNDIISCQGLLDRPHPYTLPKMERKFDPLPSIGSKDNICSVEKELERRNSRTWSICSDNITNSNRNIKHPPVRRTKSCNGMEVMQSRKKPPRGQLPPLQHNHGTLPERPSCPEPRSPIPLEELNY